MAVQEKLKLIIRQQQLDDELDLIISERKGLPEDIEELEGQVAALSKRIEIRRKREDENKVRKQTLKGDIKVSQEKVKKYKTAQASARNNKEYDAITKQIEYEEQEIKKAETSIRGLEELEERQGQLEAKGRELMKEGKDEDLTDDMMPTDELEKQLDDISAEVKDKKKELGKIIKDTEDEETELRAKIEKHKKSVNKEIKDIFARYLHLRKGRILNAVVKLVRSSCSGCNTRVPTNRQAFIMQGGFYTCETCGRILVAETIFDEVKAVKVED
ncbi:MAG: hypothetical protein IAF08_00075 [Rhizobacter sp.]|nr:hypothetical protein [Chlorobiales bacterium]